ncbi:MAG: hypothetical protein ACK4N5_22270 [Myxococcales bacterium]
MMPAHEPIRELAVEGLRFSFQRPRPGVLLVRIEGDDRDQFGPAPFDVLDAELSRHWPLELFVDTREAQGASPRVRESWTEWFSRNRHRLKRVSILASTRYMNVTIGVAKLFSRTGELIQIYSDPALFEQALAVASSRSRW